MSSIRRKLFLQILLVILFIISALWLANTFMLEPYYMKTKKDQLIRARNSINSFGVSDYGEKVDFLVDLGNELNAMILIFNDSGYPVYTTHNIPQESGGFVPEIDTRRIPPSRNPLETIYSEKIDSGTEIELAIDKMGEQRFLSLKSKLDNGFSIHMSIPVSSIESSVSVVNGFLMVVALISSILALIIAFIISRKFTGSILHMNRITKKMKDLDFSEKCEIDSRDEFGQLAGSIDDLSESLDSTLKELGEKNEALKKEIEHKKVVEEMRKQFITNVSHELKTPLSLIQGYAEGLELNVASGEEKRAFYCSVIREETEKMGRLVKDLLDLSMMETGNFTLYKREFCIDELIRKVTGKFEKVLTENGIDLAYVEGEKTVVYADSFRTEQILTNYLDNAMHHVDERKEIRVRKDVQGNSVIMRVFNSGQNIPGKESEKIWTSFYRADNARTREEERYGIGLSIVKAICDLDGKSHGFVNLPDGVEFFFELERAETLVI
jgi:signal transduction histidine kinase